MYLSEIFASIQALTDLWPANNLTESLIENGIKIRRFKTGTPARVDKRSIDFS